MQLEFAAVRETWDLQGRTAFVTGGARGIGLETARRLVARGMNVALVDLDEEVASPARALDERLAVGLTADVTDRGALDAAVSATCERFGGIDVCVANAGVAPPTATIGSVDPDRFERTIEIDLLGVWRTVRATLPQITARGGYVLVVSSIYAFFNGALAAPYAISKAGVEQLGRALRVELAPWGAGAGVAYFGFVDTDLVQEAFSRPIVSKFRSALPSWLTQPIPVEHAADAMAAGIERRAARVTAPGRYAAGLVVRGLLAPLDALFTRNETIVEAIREADARPEGGPLLAGEIRRA